MLRALALVLLVANALLLAAQFGAFDRLTVAGSGLPQQRDPDRAQRQLHPEWVQVLTPPAASAALAAAAASVAQAGSAASSAASSAANGAAALACLEAGPFGAADAEVAERTLRDAGLAPGSWLAQTTQEAGAFMVYMGRYADRETLQRKLDEVKRLKLEVEELRGPAEWLPGLSLGRFADKAAAESALARMVQRGVHSAKVITLRTAKSQTVLRVAAADAATRARLAGLRLPSGPGFTACTIDSVATPASSSAAQSLAPIASAAGTAALTGPTPTPRNASAPSNPADPLSMRR